MGRRRECCCDGENCLCPWCSSGPCWEDYPTVEFSAIVEGVGISLVQANYGVGSLLSTVVLIQGTDTDDCGIDDVETNICAALGAVPAGPGDEWIVGFYWYMRGSDLMMLVCLDFVPSAGSAVCDSYVEEVTLVSGGSTVDCDTFSESGSAPRCFTAECSAGPSSAAWSIAAV